MTSHPEPENLISSDPESVANLEYAQLDAGARVSPAGSLLDLSPAHAEYVRRLEEIVRREAPLERVLEWDRAKMPPLPVLLAMVEEGIFVSGVPLPDVSLAAEFAAELVRSGVLPAEVKERFESLPPGHSSQQEFLRQVGREGHALAMGVAAETTARLGGVGIGTFMGVSTGLSAQTIYRVGTLAQQAFWLNALNRGLFTYAFALTEQNAGSDPRSLTTTFVKETLPGGQTVYRLNGDKKFIGNAARVMDASGRVVHRGADFLLVFAVDDPARPPKDRVFHCFLVPRQSIREEHIRHTGGEWNKTGLREVNNGNFDLVDVVVPECCVLGIPGENMYSKLLGTLDVTRFLVGAMGVGTAEAAFEIASRYAEERRQNGLPIARYPLVACPLRELESRILVGKLLVREAASLVDQADRQRQELADALNAARAAVSELQAPLARIFSFVRDAGGERACREALSACEAALAERGERIKLGDRQRQFRAAVQALHAQTRRLRDEAPAESALLAKAVYRRSQLALDLLSSAAEPIRFGLETAMAKLYGSELAQQTIYQARQTLGGNGYLESPTEGLGLGKRSRDAEVLSIYEGQSNIQRGLIAQGILLKHIQKVRMPLLAPGSIWQKLNFLLLNTRLTKETHYQVLMSTSRTPVERANAAFKYAVVDVMGRYNDSLQSIKARWRKEGAPAEFHGWDEASLERQQNLLAANPIQARLGLLADLAVYRKLIHLASRELERARRLANPTPGARRNQELLEEFSVLGLERVLELVGRLSGQHLALLEQRARQSTQI